MSKRYFSHLDDGAPGEDDARYGPYPGQLHTPQASSSAPPPSASASTSAGVSVANNNSNALPPPTASPTSSGPPSQYHHPLAPLPQHFQHAHPPPFSQHHSHGPGPFTYPYTFQQPYPSYPPPHALTAPPQMPHHSYLPPFASASASQATLGPPGPPSMPYTAPRGLQRQTQYPPIPASHRPQAPNLARPGTASTATYDHSSSSSTNARAYGGRDGMTVGDTRDRDEEEEEDEEPMEPMYVPGLCLTPQFEDGRQAAEARTIPIMRPPTPPTHHAHPQRPLIPLPARAAADETYPQGNEERERDERRGGRRARLEPPLGANEGTRPDGPTPLHVLTFPHVGQGDDARRANADLQLGDERTDPNDDSTWFNVTDENRASFFREVAGRKLNVIQPTYQLPADQDEIKRGEYFHKTLYMVMGDKNHVGPIEEVLGAPCDRQRRVLDIGTGGGMWAIQIADEFPDVEVIGCDLAPIQPEMVPPNCTFELFDAQLNPYPNEYFDVVHARGVHTGIRNYPLFLEEIGRILAPGGLVILVETEVCAMTQEKGLIEPGTRGGAPGWHAFWDQYRKCLEGNHVDTSVPTRLGMLLRGCGAFDDIVAREACYPIGFWPKEEHLIAVGEHAWMDHDFFLPACKPLFKNYGLSDFRAKILVEDAQQDLYYPLTRPYGCVHVSQARKVPMWTAPRRRGRRLR